MTEQKTCPHCAAGKVARLRVETGEWVHDFAEHASMDGKRIRIGHSICLDDPKYKAKHGSK